MGDIAFLARMFFAPRDIGIYLTAILMLVMMQGLIWGIARHSTDIEFWRCVGLCAIAGIAAITGYAIGGSQGWLLGILLGAFAGYLIAGFVYDFDLWQRLVVTVCAPVFAFVSFYGGYWLKGILITKVFASWLEAT